MSINSKHKPKFKITVGKHSGFCFGVKRAYDLACVNSKDCDDIYILGKLVHNNDVCEDLRKRGIQEIKSLSAAKNATLIFTAHGIGPRAYEKAQRRGLKIIDTTCPKVMKAQRLAKSFAGKGYQVIIFGDKNHKEVKSILEWSGGKAMVIGSLAEAKKLKPISSKKYFLISQTTQNVEELKKINKYLSDILLHFSSLSTICDSTDSRQKEVRKLAKANDAVIIIGGRDSANSRRLYEIAKSVNKKTYFIENEKKLRTTWFKNNKNIFITAGASTPEWIIKKTVDKINKIA